MHPRLEIQVLPTIKTIGRLVSKTERWQNLLLTAFALDDQEAEGQFDPVHDQVDKVSQGLLRIVDDLRLYYEILVRLHNSQPVAGQRAHEIANCEVCGEMALPNPVSGFCQKCFALWKEFRHQKRGDRFVFMRVRKQELIDQLAANQEADT